jgi:hypothetical protein
MEEIVYKALLNSFHKRLAYLAGKKIIKLADYAKAEKISYSNLLNKAKCVCSNAKCRVEIRVTIFWVSVV